MKDTPSFRVKKVERGRSVMEVTINGQKFFLQGSTTDRDPGKQELSGDIDAKRRDIRNARTITCDHLKVGENSIWIGGLKLSVDGNGSQLVSSYNGEPTKVVAGTGALATDDFPELAGILVCNSNGLSDCGKIIFADGNHIPQSIFIPSGSFTPTVTNGASEDEVDGYACLHFPDAAKTYASASVYLPENAEDIDIRVLVKPETAASDYSARFGIDCHYGAVGDTPATVTEEAKVLLPASTNVTTREQLFSFTNPEGLDVMHFNLWRDALHADDNFADKIHLVGVVIEYTLPYIG